MTCFVHYGWGLGEGWINTGRDSEDEEILRSYPTGTRSTLWMTSLNAGTVNGDILQRRGESLG